MLLVFNVFNARGGPLTASSLSPFIKGHIILPTASNFYKALKNETQVSKLQGKNAFKSIYDISAYYFKKMKVCKGIKYSREVLEDEGTGRFGNGAF